VHDRDKVAFLSLPGTAIATAAGMSGANCTSAQAAAAAAGATNSDTQGHCTDPWTGLQVKYSFATEGVGLFFVAIVGILANFISIVVLTQRTMKTQISALLITLAVFDILFLFCTFPVFTVQSVNAFVEYLNTCVYPDGTLEGRLSSRREDGQRRRWQSFCRRRINLLFVERERKRIIEAFASLFTCASSYLLASTFHCDCDV
jgi:hypothetical protein